MNANELVEWVAETMYRQQKLDGDPRWANVGSWRKNLYHNYAEEVLSHPDFALIDRGKKLPATRCLPHPDKQTEPYKTISVDVPRHWDIVSLESYLTNLTQGDMLEAGYLAAIPLAEALKEE